MSKEHGCIAALRGRMMQNNGKLKWVKFSLTGIVNTDGTSREEKTGQEIIYGYEHKKKDGSAVIKQGKSFVAHTYCPFCGKKYK